jgi:hypothetical protein
MLYRSTDCLSRAGAPVKNLAHSASRDSCDENAPSNPGIKHLGAGIAGAAKRSILSRSKSGLLRRHAPRDGRFVRGGAARRKRRPATLREPSVWRAYGAVLVTVTPGAKPGALLAVMASNLTPPEILRHASEPGMTKPGEPPIAQGFAPASGVAAFLDGSSAPHAPSAIEAASAEPSNKAPMRFIADLQRRVVRPRSSCVWKSDLRILSRLDNVRPLAGNF